MSYKTRLTQLIKELNSGLYEKEQALKLILLSLFANKSIFLYGPPGTAKSLLARRVSLAFSKGKGHFFNYLLNRFSTPEEIFGPIDIGELKKNNLKRKTEGYLPTADFAFLDEIWKSSPAILNTLLTIINEKIYRDGNEDIKVPLKGLVCASNEFPMPNQGLEALYDRMILRYAVLPTQEKTSFESLLRHKSQKDPAITAPFSLEELENIATQSQEVDFSQDSLEILHFLKSHIESHNSAQAKEQKNQAPQNPQAPKGVYISDRRWRQMGELLKTAAFLSDRKS